MMELKTQVFFLLEIQTLKYVFLNKKRSRMTVLTVS